MIASTVAYKSLKITLDLRRSVILDQIGTHFLGGQLKCEATYTWVYSNFHTFNTLDVSM